MKKFILTTLYFIFLLVSGCYNPGKLYVSSLNNWKAIYLIDVINPSQNINISNANLLPYVLIHIDNIPARKKEKNCSNRIFNINFELFNYSNKEKELINFLNNNQLTFDTSKVYIIKDGKKYKINLYIPTGKVKELTVRDPFYSDYWDSLDKGKNDYIMNVSGMLLTEIDRGEKFVLINVGNIFVLPFGCQALEGTTLIIDGISLNGQPLEPIEIKLSYKNKKN